MVSVKVPWKLFQALPAAGNGRSRFILSAVAEKLQRKAAAWQPTTARGRRLKAMLDRGAAERGPLLSDEAVAAELQERRGRHH